jgi:hypothetical protein
LETQGKVREIAWAAEKASQNKAAGGKPGSARTIFI